MIFTVNKKGFSLMEVLIAISLLLLVLIGPMQLLSQTGNSTKYATEQVSAYFLAQEAIELVHKYRDDLLLEYFRSEFLGSGNSINPMEMMSVDPIASCYSGTGCGVYLTDIHEVNFVTCGSSAGAEACLLRESSSSLIKYTHSTTDTIPTPFIRRVEIERVPESGRVTELKVTAIVEWRTGSLLGGQRVQLVTYLQNIYDTE